MKINKIHLYSFVLTLSIAFFFAVNINAQSTRLLNIEDGLSNNIVYDIQEDAKGFIWFATENGLNRYDGYSFQKFSHNPNDSTSVASNVCRNILKDNKGNLWIATKNGLSFFDEITETFVNFKEPNRSLDIKELELVSNNKIWFNTLGVAGFFDVNMKKFHFINSTYNSFCMTSNQKNVWINSLEGSVDKIKKNTADFTNITKGIGVRKQIHFGKYSQKLWIPKPNNDFTTSYNIIPRLPNNIEPTKLLEIDKNTLLIGTNLGILNYKINSNKLTKVKLTENITTLNQQIRSIYKDITGNIWVGTLGGVFHIDYYEKSFNHLTVNTNSDDIIMGLTSDENILYFNEFGKAIYKYNDEKKSVEKLPISSNTLKESLFIWDIKKTIKNNGNLWLATNAGLLDFDINKKKIKKIKLPQGEDFYESSYNLSDTDTNFIWVASHSGIHKISKKEQKINILQSELDLVEESNIQKIIAAHNKVFIGTEGKGLFFFDENTNQLTPVYQQNNQKIQSAIWDMILIDDELWLGTNEGIYTVDIQSLKAQKTNITENIIFSIQKDSLNRLWMGTDKGLMSYDLKSKYVDTYTKDEGVTNTEFNRRSSTKTKNGKFWFGGVKGITYFNPEAIKNNPIIPKVYITSLKVFDADSTFDYNHRKNLSVVLPYYQNTISLEYVALNYTNSQQNHYKYQLVGRDKNWVEDNGFRFSRYVQLPPGKYTFKVKAANNDGVWSTENAELSIEILPPLWKTLWFQVLVFLLIVIVIYTIYYFRIKRLLAIERMKLRIASDLHDEVGSGLSGIALTSDILEQQFQKGDIKPHLLTRITKNARNLAATLDDIVWLINPEKETLEDFLLKTKTLTKEHLEHLNLSFKEHLNSSEKNKLLSVEQKRNLFLFVKEVIHNIVKHANAQNVTIAFETKKNHLYMMIVDDGVGFDTSQKTNRNGLASLRSRAETMKGVFSIQSKKNIGTQVSLQIKIP